MPSPLSSSNGQARPRPGGPPPLPRELAPGVAEISRSVTDFALRLFAQIRERPGNLACSPQSIFSALALLSGGAAGETLDEIRRVLAVDLPEADLHAALIALRQQLLGAAAAGGPKIQTGCNVWLARDRHPLDAFVTLSEQYGGGVRSLDFAGDPSEAAEAINTWVQALTGGGIPKIVEASNIAGLTSAYTASATRFRGRWLVQFDPKKTAPAPFQAAGGKTVSVPTMHAESVIQFSVGQADGASLLEMPYTGRRHSMIVLLPEAVDGLAELERRLAPKMLEDWPGGVRRYPVEVSLPRFRCTTRVDLAAPLAGLGLHLSLRPEADFSRLDGSRDSYVGGASHCAMVEVTEEGTEAAAATLVSMLKGGPLHFRVDHPFLFFIRDTETGLLLFMGRVENPVEGMDR